MGQNMKYHSLLKNLFYATFSIMALNFSGVTMAKNTMNDIYVINLSSNNAVCGVKINEMLVMHNKKYPKGHYSAGQNISSVLENGKNTLGIIMFNGSVFTGEEKLTPDMWCEVELKKLSANGDNTLISGLRLNGNNDGKMVVSDKYQNNSEHIYFGSPSRKSEFDALEAKNQFNIQDLPQWQWEKATPVTEDDIPKIRAFYGELRQAFIDKNLDKLKTMGKISWEEMAYADNGSPDIFWNSLEFKELLKDGYKPSDIDWNRYELNTYNNNRLFRYEIGFSRLSPIKLVNPEERTFHYNPYLSIIDGKVTIVR